MTDTAIEPTPQPIARQTPIFSGLSLLIGVTMVLAIIFGIAGGSIYGWKGQVGMLILASIPICTLGVSLALIGLIWRKESKMLGQFGLWINGLLGFFGFPILCFWLIRG